MSPTHLPAPLSRLAMSVIPAPLLQRLIDRLVGRMRVSHARLFQNLARLHPAVVRIEPTDLPHAFILAYGKGDTSLKLATAADQTCDACIKGKLEALLDMLEGRTDGDMMFFSRDIDISGDTSVIVGLRNTLDREEINLLDDVTSLCGPFAVPARRAFGLANRVAERVMNRLADITAKRQNGPTHAKNSVMENDRLRAEIKNLKTRLAKFDVRQKQKAAQ